MELQSVSLARCLWFIHTSDINPHGLNLWNTLFPALLETYGFVGFPKKEDRLNPNREPGDKFTGGTFRNSQGLDVAISFTSFDDGFVADTQSTTRDSEDFLLELTGWIVKDFGLRFTTDMIYRRGYVSELFVKSEHEFSGLKPELRAFAERVSELIPAPEMPVEYRLSGMSFSPNNNVAIKPSPFILERAADTLFSENRYYSKAPFHTDVHLELLDELEQMLK